MTDTNTQRAKRLHNVLKKVLIGNNIDALLCGL